MSTDSVIPVTNIGVGNLAIRFLKKASQWAIIYIWGYYALSPGWLLAPLFLSVLRNVLITISRCFFFNYFIFRYQWKKEKESRISSAQATARASEKEVDNPNIHGLYQIFILC